MVKYRNKMLILLPSNFNVKSGKSGRVCIFSQAISSRNYHNYIIMKPAVCVGHRNAMSAVLYSAIHGAMVFAVLF